MEKYMNISHNIMTEIYNMSSSKEDYNFSLFTHNRDRLAEMLEFAENTRNTLLLYKSKNSINIILMNGKTNYISEKNILFTVKFDHNMIKSKNSMNIFNNILKRLEYQIGNNDLLEIERQRGFVRKQTCESGDYNSEYENDTENVYFTEENASYSNNEDCYEFE